MMMDLESDRSHEERLKALYEISSRLGSTLDLGELLDYVIDSVLQLTEGDRGIIVLVNEYNEIEPKTFRGIDADEYHDEKLPVSRTIVTQVVNEDKPILTDNAQDDPRFGQSSSVIGYQFRSIMCAPLRARGKVIGAVIVDNRLTDGVFGEDDLDLLETFANQAAIAIENARLFKQTDQDLQRRIEELELLQAIDRDLHKTLDLHITLDLIVDKAVNFTAAEWGALGLIEQSEDRDDETEILQIFSFNGEDEVSIKDQAVSLTHPTVAEILETGETVHVRSTSESQTLGGNTGYAQIGVPIKLDHTIIGIIILESNFATYFDDEDIAYVNRLADRAAVAIGNSRLYLKLQKAIEARNTFISLMTHELRIPLTSIRGYADLLAKQLVGPLTDQQSNFIDIIRRNISRMSALISDLSDINRMESNRLALDVYNFDMSTAIDEVVNKFRSEIDAKGQILDVVFPPTPVHARADYARTTQILSNLVSNAHRYTPSGGTITIRLIPGQSRDQHLKVEVEDTGMGMSVEDLGRAVEMFFRSDDPDVREQAGWGLGLSVAEMLVEKMEGRLSLESNLGEGSVATMYLPQANVML